MKILTGEIDPEKGSVNRPSEWSSEPGPLCFDLHRVMDTVIMGNARCGGPPEREILYAKDPDTLTESGRHAPW